MSHEECEMLNKHTAPHALKRIRAQKAITAACWGLVFLLGFMLGLAM